MDEDALREITDFLQDGVPGSGDKLPQDGTEEMSSIQRDRAQIPSRLVHHFPASGSQAGQPQSGKSGVANTKSVSSSKASQPLASNIIKNIPVGIVPSLPEGLPISPPKRKTRTKAVIVKKVKAKSVGSLTSPTVHTMLQQQQAVQAAQQAANQAPQQQQTVQQQIVQQQQTTQHQITQQQTVQQQITQQQQTVQQQITQQQQTAQQQITQQQTVQQQIAEQQQVVPNAAQQTVPEAPPDEEVQIQLPNGQFMAVSSRLAQIVKDVPGEVIQLQTGEVWHVPEGQTLTLPDGRSITAKSGKPVNIVAGVQTVQQVQQTPEAMQAVVQTAPVVQPTQAIIHPGGQAIIQGQNVIGGQQYIQTGQNILPGQAIIQGQGNNATVVAAPTFQMTTVGNVTLGDGQTYPVMSHNVVPPSPVHNPMVGAFGTQAVQTMQIPSGTQIIQTPDGQLVQIQSVLNSEPNVVEIVTPGVPQPSQNVQIGAPVMPVTAQVLPAAVSTQMNIAQLASQVNTFAVNPMDAHLAQTSNDMPRLTSQTVDPTSVPAYTSHVQTVVNDQVAVSETDNTVVDALSDHTQDFITTSTLPQIETQVIPEESPMPALPIPAVAQTSEVSTQGTLKGRKKRTSGSRNGGQSSPVKFKRDGTPFNRHLLRDANGKFAPVAAKSSSIVTTSSVANTAYPNIPKSSSFPSQEDIPEDLGNILTELISGQLASDTNVLSNPNIVTSQIGKSTSVALLVQDSTHNGVDGPNFATPVSSPLRSPTKGLSKVRSPDTKSTPGSHSKASESSHLSSSGSDSEDDSKFRCKFCNKSFDTASVRRQHQEWFCDNKPLSTDITAEDFDVYPCEICNKELDTERGLKLHMVSSVLPNLVLFSIQ